MRHRSSRILAWALALASLAFAPIVLRAQARSTIDGRVMDATTGGPIAFANVTLSARTRPVVTDERGRFRFDDLFPGRHRLIVSVAGYAQRETTVEVTPGRDVTLTLDLERRGASARAAPGGSDVVGADTPADHVLACEIVPVGAFAVGDRPRFEVRIRNRGRTAVWLPKSLDGSPDNARQPAVSITIEGPANGFVTPPLERRANLNPLKASDFVRLAPGAAFDPFVDGFFPVTLQGTFAKPGRYVATFRYSTDEPDVRKWLALDVRVTLADELSRRLRETPRVTLTDRVAFVVRR